MAYLPPLAAIKTICKNVTHLFLACIVFSGLLILQLIHTLDYFAHTWQTKQKLKKQSAAQCSHLSSDLTKRCLVCSRHILHLCRSTVKIYQVCHNNSLYDMAVCLHKEQH